MNPTVLLVGIPLVFGLLLLAVSIIRWRTGAEDPANTYPWWVAPKTFWAGVILLLLAALFIVATLLQ